MSPWRGLPLAGRRYQLTEIETVRRSGAAGAVLVTGASGVGKTRLATEGLARAGAAGCATRWVAATRATRGIPFGALAHLLPESDDEPRGTPAGRLQAAARTLRRLARDHSMVVGVDDIDLLDDASAALVHHVIASGIAFVIATARTVERLPDVVTSLWRQGGVRCLELDPLTEHETAELLHAYLGGQVDGRARRRLHHLSQGNALYLRELVHAAMSAGTLGNAAGVWRLRGGLLPTAPLDRLLSARLDEAGSAVRRVVETVALGEPLGLGLLERAGSRATLETAEAAGLIRVLSDGRRQELRLAHPLVGEVLRTGLPRLRRNAIHRGLAEALAERGARRRGDLLRLAIWQLESGARTNPELLLTAAREAARLRDHRLAVRLALSARETGAGFPATLLAAEARAWQGRTDLAEELFAFAAREAAEPGQRAHLARSRGAMLFLGGGRLASALRVLEPVRSHDAADAAMRLVVQAFVQVQAGRITDGLRILRPLADRPPTETVRRHALPALANALTAAGRTEEALRTCRSSARVLGPRRDQHGQLWDGLGLVTFNALMYHGRLRHAERLSRVRYEKALDADHDQARTAWAYARGRAAYAQGRFATAERWLREGLHPLREHPTLMGPAGLLTCLGDLAVIAALGGRPEAADLLGEADRAMPDNLFAPDYTLARAWVEHLHGDRERARARAWEAARRASALGGHAYAARALHVMVRFGAADRAAPPLDELAGRLQGPVPAAFAAHAAALRGADTTALRRCAAAFGRLGMMRLAAEAAGTAAGWLRRRAHHGEAAAAAAVAARYARRCDGAPVRALLPDDPIAALTGRERELGRLAAAGLTNRAIAERLFLSVRTVENHLHRTYAKLGVTSRAQLCGFLWESGG